MLCGGENSASDSCLQWSPDTRNWEELNLKLDVERYAHVSWTPGTVNGTYLMGGWYSQLTTTLIKPDRTQEPGFPLNHTTV